MKRKEINGYQPKELIVADVIAYMRDRDRIRITDLRILDEVFFGCVCDLKSYPEDEKIQTILKSEVSSIVAENTIAIFIRSNDPGKFDVEDTIRRLKNMETNPQFFDQMIMYNASRVSGEENKSLKNIVEEFKKLATRNADDIHVKYQQEPVCPFHPISENPGESYELLSQMIPVKTSVDFESLDNNPKIDGLTLTIYNRRLRRGGNDNDDNK